MSRLLLLFCVLLAGCAGYRSGEVSRAYVEMPPPAEAIARGTPNWLQVPGARLRVELRNEVQRREHQVVLFIVPVMIDPRDRPLYSQDQGARLLLEISAAEAAHFRPEHAVLWIDGQAYRPSGVQRLTVFDPGRQPLTPLREVEERAPAGLSYSLDRAGRHYQFWLRFAAPMPAPKQAIRLDLSAALQLRGQPPVPPIRFRPVPWKQGYT
ncbi:hypothetical protein I0D00_05905 [Pseudomonas lalucatii]|uniref:Lipoprotein n=1 Tax=Pseudomonas lalucatii TaxID=1424203 RepID=A0ABS5Q013_9PSED|nr:hypothetical protein [Pseudomonas lalucatii]MBS7661484.1 hypothetical protein [Pseudomonas lalucatii]